MTTPLRCELTAKLVGEFAAAIADHSSLHTNAGFARLTRFRRPVVHGLLPVALLLMARAPEGTRLRAIACRFAQPAAVGSTVDLALVNRRRDGDVHYAGLDIRDAHTGVSITTGTVEFTARAGHALPRAQRDSLFLSPPPEAALDITDLSCGHSETLTFAAAPAALRQVAPVDWTGLDPAMIAALAASTLVGMRLPGRHATFLEFSAAFPEAVPAGAEVQLQGVVTKVSSASRQVRLDLTWTVDGSAAGSGWASTLVNSPCRKSLSCAEISGDHLTLGIAGKVALITGSSRGIGEAVAKLLAMQGCKVAVHCFQGAGDAAVIAADIRANGGTALAVAADLSDQAAIERMFARVRNEVGEVDILVHAAVREFSPKVAMALKPQDYIDELQVSLFGMHACCQQALPHMRARRWGKIITFGTVATEVPVSGQNKYTTIKSALTGYTRSLAAELLHDNVQVNMVVPRMTETSLLAALPPALVEKFAGESPTGQLLQPVDVAKAVLFLVSDWAASISGQRIVLNQGEAPFL